MTKLILIDMFSAGRLNCIISVFNIIINLVAGTNVILSFTIHIDKNRLCWVSIYLQRIIILKLIQRASLDIDYRCTVHPGTVDGLYIGIHRRTFKHHIRGRNILAQFSKLA